MVQDRTSGPRRRHPPASGGAITTLPVTVDCGADAHPGPALAVCGTTLGKTHNSRDP